MYSMPKGEFIAEHKRLIGLLKAHVDGTKRLEKEMKRQEAELKKTLKKK
jgi:hypothetical protein